MFTKVIILIFLNGFFPYSSIIQKHNCLVLYVHPKKVLQPSLVQMIRNQTEKSKKIFDERILENI
ncbi:unnamed protein product [Paramecium octaurelia]|uniref:Uncharacterized protein n=1 Tax=Paramecium octaurelia TaxID=43137 RepID=A0A8S1V4X5_PAROT|nr:unnamed protein product [Paramecium octaurelia]